MEVILSGYVLFALITAIQAYKFYYRAIQEAKFLKVENSFTDSSILGSMVFLILAFLAAPLLIIPVLFDSVGEKFYEQFKQPLLED